MVKLKEPAAVGVPPTTPDELRFRPAGSPPELTEKLSGKVPPDTPTVCEYGWFTVALGSEPVVMLGDGLMTTTYDCDPDESSESVAVTVKLKLPVAEGVPAIVPLELSSARPVGRVPVDD